MKNKKLRIKVLKKLLEDTVTQQVAMEIGQEIKQAAFLQVKDEEQAREIEKQGRIEAAMLAQQPMVIAIITRKLKEAENENLSSSN